MGLEFELKYVATPEKLSAIRKKWEGWVTFSMKTTYFDTPDGRLSKENCTLRQRLENGISVCTLKTPTDGFGRGEWDAQAPWNADTVAQLFSTAQQKPVDFSQLSCVCGARFTRLAKTVVLPLCTVEIALDEGVLLGNNQEIPLCELEVELKEGDEAAAAAWANTLAAEFNLQPERKSKFRRALVLAKGV